MPIHVRLCRCIIKSIRLVSKICTYCLTIMTVKLRIVSVPMIQGGLGGGGPMDFGKNKSKFQEVPETGVTFDDVAVRTTQTSA